MGAPEGIDRAMWEAAVVRLRSALQRAALNKDHLHITGSRESVLAKYGPVFQRDAVANLEGETFLAFLNFKENCHWFGIHRHGAKVTRDLPRLRTALADLLDEAQPLAARFDRFRKAIPGTGPATITPVLLVAAPTRYGCWNATSTSALKTLQIHPQVPPTASQGAQYEAINQVCLRLAADLGLSLWDLDALFYALPRVEDGAKPMAAASRVSEAPFATPARVTTPRPPLNLILYGPPGTGKTWSARRRALEICGYPGLSGDAARDRFRKLVQECRIRFVTFHQSFSYEDFVEGIRPETDAKGTLRYEARPGVFKSICEQARQRPSVAPIALGQCRFWKFSLRDVDGELYRECIAKGVIRMGWGGEIDFTDCDDRAAIVASITKSSGERPSKKSYEVAAVNRLKNLMAIGDLVLVPDALNGIQAIGRVSGSYAFRSDLGKDQQVRPVQWLRVFDEAIPRERLLHRNLAMATIYELRRSRIDMGVLADLLAQQEGAPERGVADPHVLLIDEINRANVSKVLGELITLLEPDKRIGAENETTVTLPYSRDTFGVPSNLHLIGTMNTADRSLAFLDLALRRRFEFERVGPDYGVLPPQVQGLELPAMLRSLNRRVEVLLDADHAIGHAYFLDVATLDQLALVFRRKVLPLLEEYFQGDLAKVALCLNCAADEGGRQANDAPILTTSGGRGAALPGVDEFDDRVRYELNADFERARGEDLLPWLDGLIDDEDDA